MFDEFGFPRDADADHASTLLDTFVYCSRAAEGVDDAEVDRIIERSQRSNVARDITGVLVFGSGVFFQWIEGPPTQVEKLIASLRGDHRHYDIVTLDRSVEKRERLYPNWEMERVGADDIRAVLQEALGSAEDENNIAALTRIIGHLDAGQLDTLHSSSTKRNDGGGAAPNSTGPAAQP
ncbi:BLUF domain-containing protein [Roseomonas sp. CCTCC AB2023176]|uniref:BLUF domain-containing protein n=1 Tax=Roseomonas sp. CCTCC AB2023176 TaxID=3342640 RepID=UPI0035D793F3